MWSLDSDDCRTTDPERVAAAVSPARVKPGEVVWSEQDQEYYMAPAACVVFMLFEAYAPDASISAEQHAHNRASVKRGVSAWRGATAT